MELNAAQDEVEALLAKGSADEVELGEAIAALGTYRDCLAELVRSLAPTEPETDPSGVEQAIVDALEDAAKAVERGHR